MKVLLGFRTKYENFFHFKKRTESRSKSCIEERVEGRVDEVGGAEDKRGDREDRGGDTRKLGSVVEPVIKLLRVRRAGKHHDRKDKRIAHKLIDIAARNEARSSAEHYLYIIKARRQPERVDASVKHEQYPAENDEKQRVNVPEHCRKLGYELAEKGFFDYQKHAVINAPQDKVPRRAVPESGQKPDYHQIAIGLEGSLAASAEREIDIFAEPARKRDVPAPPKIRDTVGNVGIVEIFKEMKAEYPAHADRHIGVTGKIKVYLERKADYAEPRADCRKLVVRRFVAHFPKRARRVRKQHLFAKPLDRASYA